MGLHVGILGLIVAVALPESMKEWPSSLGAPVTLWLIGLILVLGAYIEEARSGR